MNKPSAWDVDLPSPHLGFQNAETEEEKGANARAPQGVSGFSYASPGFSTQTATPGLSRCEHKSVSISSVGIFHLVVTGFHVQSQ